LGLSLNQKGRNKAALITFINTGLAIVTQLGILSTTRFNVLLKQNAGRNYSR